jgi:hypothetical protein
LDVFSWNKEINMGFSTVDEAAAWAEGNGGEQGIREALAAGRFGADKRTIETCKEWLRQKEEAREHEAIDEERQLRTREVMAAEISATAARESADAAKDSADAAKRSARWAGWAAIIALLAVVVAVFK